MTTPLIVRIATINANSEDQKYYSGILNQLST